MVLFFEEPEWDGEGYCIRKDVDQYDIGICEENFWSEWRNIKKTD
jgi:hypothetical protein